MNFHLRGCHLVVVTALLSAGCAESAMTAAAAVVLPDPAVDEPVAASKGQPAAVFAGGCFWGVDAVFKHMRGVTRVTSGYAGGSASTAVYDIVGTGRTGHAESVEILYDRAQISYGQLLKIFFASEEQRRIGRAYIDQLNAARAFPRPIVTEVAPLKAFYQAEPYHQNYVARHPDIPYIRVYDLPKVEHLRIQFPDLYVSR